MVEGWIEDLISCLQGIWKYIILSQMMKSYCDLMKCKLSIVEQDVEY